MKQLVGFGVLLMLAVFGGFLFLGVASEERDYLVGLAIGNPQGDSIELHVAVSLGMANCEGRKAIMLSDGSVAAQNEFEWIDEHFILRDTDGNRVPLRKVGHSNIVSAGKALNPEYFLVGQLKIGQSYTFDYKPFRDVPSVDRYAFTATAEGQKYERVALTTIDES